MARDVKFSNRLTDAELERLAILAEECAEVIEIVGKILRHGYESFNPFDPKRVTNRDLLAAEIGDVQHAVGMLVTKNDVQTRLISNGNEVQTRADKIKPYLHHQGEDLDG